MRKRELEKLLYLAVADALGVEPKAGIKRDTKIALRTVKKAASPVHEHRAAA